MIDAALLWLEAGIKEGIKALNHGQRGCGSNARRGKTLPKNKNK